MVMAALRDLVVRGSPVNCREFHVSRPWLTVVVTMVMVKMVMMTIMMMTMVMETMVMETMAM